MKELKAYDAVVFDPPRAGAAAQAETLAKSEVSRLVAISCNPGTLARDLRILVDGGYRITRVTPVDQFRFSPHIEVVAHRSGPSRAASRRTTHVGPHGAGTAASRANRLGGKILGPGIARETNGAQRAAKLAMHMDQLVRAGGFMQAIDVLRHGEDAAMLPLQPRERRVRRVRPRLAMQPAAEIVEIVHARRIACEAFGDSPSLSRNVPSPLSADSPAPVRTTMLRKAISPCRSGRDAGGNGRPARWPPSPRRSALRGCRRKDRGGPWSRPPYRGLMCRPSGAGSKSKTSA